MSAPASERLTEQEYLARERQAEKKSEYFAGQLFALAGLDAVLQLESIACRLAARDVYERVEVG